MQAKASEKIHYKLSQPIQNVILQVNQLIKKENADDDSETIVYNNSNRSD
jgi:hypothetical protein